MAVAPRNFPLPRGPLTHNLDTYYINRLATAATEVTAAGGNIPQIGLHNNASDGSFLYVVGFSIWYSIATSDVPVYAYNGIPPNATLTPGVSINPYVGQLPGELVSIGNGSVPGGSLNIWRTCGGGVPEYWPYDAPVYILQPGWALFTSPPTGGGTLSAAFRWLVFRLSE